MSLIRTLTELGGYSRLTGARHRVKGVVGLWTPIHSLYIPHRTLICGFFNIRSLLLGYPNGQDCSM